MSALLQVEQISKRYGAGPPAVDGVTLHVAAGELVCLLGPSGCGKTTLLRLIAGLEQADGGHVSFDGRQLTGVPPHRRDFGMMFQQFALFPHLTVAQNIAYGLRVQGMDAAARAARVAEMLRLVDLPEAAARSIDQLSGGEQQRVALARALAVKPRLLLLDEPLGALDRLLRERLMVELRDILKRLGLTALYVTHDQSEAFAVADRIAVMQAGRIAQITTPQALYARPATPFVARFLGFENILSGRARDAQTVETAIGALHVAQPLTPGAALTLLVRPDAWADAAPDQIVAILQSLVFRGRYWLARFDIDGVPLLLEVEQPPTDWRLQQTVRLSLAPTGIVVLPGED